MASYLQEHPPDDGKYYDCQCGRCGSSLSFEDCPACGGEGYDGHECGEDTCACAEPEENVGCGVCGGAGALPECLASEVWCKAHPLSGRENIERATPEWYEAPQAVP